MELLAVYKDDFFPYSYIDHSRKVGRAIIINDNNEILLLKIERDDDFGNATYLETPGGGLKTNETPLEATLREVQEECGLKVTILQEIGCVEDDYNLIHRHNISYYYLAKVVDKTSMNREIYETKWIKELVWVNIDKAIAILSNPKSNIAKNVYRREKIVIERVKELL